MLKPEPGKCLMAQNRVEIFNMQIFNKYIVKDWVGSGPAIVKKNFKNFLVLKESI